MADGLTDAPPVVSNHGRAADRFRGQLYDCAVTVMQSLAQQRQHGTVSPESGLTNRQQTLLGPSGHGLTQTLLQEQPLLLRLRGVQPSRGSWLNAAAGSGSSTCSSWARLSWAMPLVSVVLSIGLSGLRRNQNTRARTAAAPGEERSACGLNFYVADKGLRKPFERRSLQ